MVHLVGFTIEIYYDARPYERHAFPCPFHCAVVQLHSFFSDKASSLCLNTSVNIEECQHKFKHNFIYKQQSATRFGFI